MGNIEGLSNKKAMVSGLKTVIYIIITLIFLVSLILIFKNIINKGFQ